MSRKNHRPPARSEQPSAPELPPDTVASEVDTPTKVSLRLSAGKHAIRAVEAEVHVADARIAGGEGIVEFDLFQETWVDIHLLRNTPRRPAEGL